MKTKTASATTRTIKPTNPKDIVGSGKIAIGLVPQSGIVLEALAFTEGAVKYGAHNYRAMGVRASVYVDACMRHLFKWQNGEECDPKTKVPHLASARACLGVILDAQLMGKLTDDRPPSNPALINMIDDLSGNVKHLKEAFADHHPYHYSIKDSKKMKK